MSMSEAEGGGSPSQDDTSPKGDTSPKVSRRNLFKTAAASVAAVAGAAASGTALAGAVNEATRGIEIPRSESEGVSYKNDSLQMLLINHMLPADISAITEHFRRTGDLKSSILNEKNLKMIDRSMQEAKTKGYPYRLFLDGFSSNVSVDHHLKTQLYSLWPHLPQPDLEDPGKYPSEIFVFGGDLPIPTDYNLKSLLPLFPETLHRPLQHMSEEAEKWFVQPEGIDVLKQAAPQLKQVATEAAMITLLVKAGLSTDMSRRAVLGLGAGMVAVELVKKLPLLYLAAGESSDPEEQAALIKAANILGESYGGEEFMSWYKARTALVVEKADYESKKAKKPDTQEPAPVDMAYGSLHGIDLPEIMKNQAYRHKLIKDHTELVLRKFDTLISEKYPDLLSQRDVIMHTVARSFTTYETFKVHMPWGKKTIPPDQLDAFNQELIENQPQTEVPALKSLVFEALKSVNVKPDLVLHF